MKAAVATTCDTDSSVFEDLMKKTESLGRLGFDVRHMVARLKEPQDRLKRLQDARAKYKDARARKEEAKKHREISSQLIDLRSKINLLERQLGDGKIHVDLAQSDKLHQKECLKDLRMEARAAKSHLRAMKSEVKAMSTKTD